MKPSKKMLTVGAVVVALAAGSLWMNDDEAAVALPETLTNRLWIDRIPVTPQDKFDIFVALADPQNGVFQHASAYEGDYAVFEWADDNKGGMKITMLQSDRRHRVKVKVSDKGCKPFDYCLELKGAPRGSKLYYSMKDMIIEPQAGLDVDGLAELVRARTAGLDR